jgi:hypothetical protein
MWQLFVGVLGLGFAGWQLWRTRVATEKSAQLLQRRLISNDLLLLLPEIHRLEDDVEDAIRTEDPNTVSSALVIYSRRVSAVVGHLKSDDNLKDEKLTKLLGQAAKAATQAKGDLFREESPDMAKLTASVVAKMTAASIEIGELVARLANK